MDIALLKNRMTSIFIEKEVVSQFHRANFSGMGGVTRVTPELRQIKPFA